jgi:hypothetical protein
VNLPLKSNCTPCLLVAVVLAGCDGASIITRARADAASLDVFASDASPADVAASDAASLADAGTDDALPADAPADAAVPDDTPVYDAAAISGWLSGNVYDGAQGTPIANAVIRANGAEIARSDADGAYSAAPTAGSGAGGATTLSRSATAPASRASCPPARASGAPRRSPWRATTCSGVRQTEPCGRGGATCRGSSARRGPPTEA